MWLLAATLSDANIEHFHLCRKFLDNAATSSLNFILQKTLSAHNSSSINNWSVNEYIFVDSHVNV